MDTACIACGSPELDSFGPYRYDSGDTFIRFAPGLRILECPNCGLIQVPHADLDLAKLTEYYAHHYREDGHSSAGSAQMRARRYARGLSLWRWGATYLERAPARLYEFGAGHALNMAAARTLWPEAELACDDLDTTSLAESDDPGVSKTPVDAFEASLDAILICHVLEHLKDPAEVLRRLHGALAPGGLVIIEVPNDRPDVVSRHHVHDPHVTFFSQNTIGALFDHRLADLYAVKAIVTAGPLLPKPGLRAELLRARRQLKRRIVKTMGIDVANPLVDNSVFDTASTANDRSFLRVVAARI